MSDRAWPLKISARVRQRSVTSKTLWANLNFFGQIIIQRYFVFVSPVELRTLYIQELPYMNTFCECISQKIELTCVHFPYNSRKLVNVVKIRFTIMYSSRKLNNKKVINFEDKLPVLSRFMAAQTTSAPSRLEKLCFEVPAFFQLTNIDVTSCFFRQFSDRSTKIRAKK